MKNKLGWIVLISVIAPILIYLWILIDRCDECNDGILGVWRRCVNFKCVECGRTGGICCEDDRCFMGICIDGKCFECGKENQIPCENNECEYGYELINGKCTEKCGYKKIRINGVCTYCGWLNDPCCENNECNFGSCVDGICVYP